jgi:cell volume regulation protein A
VPSIESILIGAALLLLLSVVASKASGRLGVPSLLIFLAIGMLAGSDGPGGIYFDDPWTAQLLGVIALALILFAGGLDTTWRSVRPVLWRGLALSTAGVLLTAMLVGWFASTVLEFTLLEGLLLGAIVSSTDAAAVFAILRSRNVSLSGQLKPLLELESGSNDPMAVFLTLALLRLLVEPDAGVADLAPFFVQQMVLGGAIGYGTGRALTLCVNRLRLEYAGLYPVLTISMILLAYGGSALVGGNGFLAVYVAGIAMGNTSFVHRNSIVRFHDGLAWLMQIAMFLTLGLLVFPSRLWTAAPAGLLVALFLAFVARPVAVFLTLAPTSSTWRERALVAWVGLRGAVPIVLATFPLLAGLPNADTIFNVVFFAVGVSVLVQGTTLVPVARLLGVEAPFARQRRHPIEIEQIEGVDADLAEFIIPHQAAVAGRTVVGLGLPPGSLITLICRDEQFFVPSGSTVIQGGDVVLVLASAANARAVGRILSALAPRGGEAP